MTVKTVRMNAELNELACPTCDGSYLRHGAVRVSNVLPSGSGSRAVIINDAGDHSIESIRPDSRRARRNRIEIEFVCQDCGGEPFRLIIAQEDGHTQIYWRPDGLSQE